MKANPTTREQAREWARRSAEELQKLAVAIPTGVVAAIYIAASGEIDPPLSGAARARVVEPSRAAIGASTDIAPDACYLLAGICIGPSERKLAV
jgi:hypothetical protein